MVEFVRLRSERRESGTPVRWNAKLLSVRHSDPRGYPSRTGHADTHALELRNGLGRVSESPGGPVELVEPQEVLESVEGIRVAVAPTCP